MTVNKTRAPLCDHVTATPGGIVRVPELLLAFAPQVPDQPVGVEGVLGGHAPAHNGIQEGLSLSGIETQHLGEGGGHMLLTANMQTFVIT